MPRAPSQSQHVSSDYRVSKGSTRNFTWQLNFPNPVKTPNLFAIKSFSIRLSLSLGHCLLVFSPPDLLPGQTGTASLQKQLVPDIDGPLPFAPFLSPLYPLLGIFSFFLATMLAISMPTLCPCLNVAPFSCFG